MRKTCIAVDFDGTLATYTTWKGPYSLGDPIVEMVDRVKRALHEGMDVWIFTARVCPTGPYDVTPKDKCDEEVIDKIKETISKWCEKHIGTSLPITCIKYPFFAEFWDDRAVRIHKNRGSIVEHHKDTICHSV